MECNDNMINSFLSEIAIKFQNTIKGKKGCSHLEFVDILHKLGKIYKIPIEVHKFLVHILNDTVGVIELHHPLLPFAELLALFIEFCTPYFVEVSSLQDDDGNVFFQIDENNNEFYFTFFDDHLEFSFGNFDNYKSVRWNACGELEPECQKVTPSILREAGASEEILEAWTGAYQVFSFFTSSVCVYSTIVSTDLQLPLLNEN